MKIAVIGANGQLGQDAVQAFVANGDEVSRLTHADIELASVDSTSQCLRALHPDLIVNTAAMHLVEKCELDAAKAFSVNALGAANLALIARELNAALMHVSTDYVFDGKKAAPYEEADAPCPLNVYGNTKLSGEYFVRSIVEKHFVVRTSALYGHSPCRAKGGLNFIELMLKLARERDTIRVVNSETVTPTATADLARQMVVLSRSGSFGLYHATAEGSCTWYDFAKEVFALAGIKINLQVAGPNEFPAKVARPQYSVLENRELKRRGLNAFRLWQESVAEYVASVRNGEMMHEAV